MIFNKNEWMPQTQREENCICFPYFKDGEMVNIKFRDARKSFKMVKDAELIFYNLSSISDKKFCIITEGEIDAMSVYEAGFGVPDVDAETGEVKETELSKWGVVSVPNGASKGNQRLEYLYNCSDWFIGLHEIIIATDGASGFGVWTSTTAGSGVQTGQLLCTLNIPEAASATVALFNVRTTFYVLFATRNK